MVTPKAKSLVSQENEKPISEASLRRRIVYILRQEMQNLMIEKSCEQNSFLYRALLQLRGKIIKLWDSHFLRFRDSGICQGREKKLWVLTFFLECKERRGEEKIDGDFCERSAKSRNCFFRIG
jgi:hypothetical protein